MLQVQDIGIGKMLQFHEIYENTLGETLKLVLENESYTNKAKELSFRFKDRPMSALDTAIFWIEYVIRHKGAHYMKNPALDLSWFAYNMIDVYAFVFIACLIMVYLYVKVIKFIAALIQNNVFAKNKFQKKKKLK